MNNALLKPSGLMAMLTGWLTAIATVIGLVALFAPGAAADDEIEQREATKSYRAYQTQLASNRAAQTKVDRKIFALRAEIRKLGKQAMRPGRAGDKASEKIAALQKQLEATYAEKQELAEQQIDFKTRAAAIVEKCPSCAHDAWATKDEADSGGRMPASDESTSN